MKHHELFVANIKCHGCMNSIQKGLAEISSVSAVEIEQESGRITFDAEESAMAAVVEKLAAMGYPAVDENNILYKAKSYISCAIGRMDGEK